MDREEAIFYVKELQKTYASMDKKVAEAVEMAIEALKTPTKSTNTPTNTPTDLINREDAMGAVQDHFNADGFKGYDDGQKMMDRIKALPSADRPSGEWEDRGIYRIGYACSLCGGFSITESNYCPNCGAKMGSD